ncbi:MAG: insulinase family protein, partial [Anaerolineae bacterium]|nr:insulinase family protein [Anaerolineae bacterium]
MTTLHGFELVKEQDIAELNTHARLYRHVRTGAELLSLENDDENKCFGITFKTPPGDSTGVPHIMEHSVLGGSRKYPVKEPFVELLKGSLNTFINAVTYPDFTTYPVASTNLQDFYNLVDVYLDAVFYPRISEKTLQQEGWHYEIEAGDDAPLTYGGIVFNEMKGAYSSPDNVLYRYTRMNLLPDTPYGHDSGGDPAAIPDLTYAQFKAFHDTFYSPSNARIWFYGDDPGEERLRLIDAFIADFDRREVEASVPVQPRFTAPRQATFGYDAGEDDRRAMLTVGWLLDDVTNLDTTLALHLLSHILVETPASPLRKALIDSGLGEDLTGGGMLAFQRETYFATGLKGTAAENADKVEAVIDETLAALVKDGLDPELVEASLNTVEFQLREMNTGSFPRGLALMVAAVPSWLHGGDPIAELAFAEPLARLKERIAAGGFFEGLIRRFFIDNPHRSTVLLEPDSSWNEQRDAAERERLDAICAGLSADDLAAIRADMAELRRIQETPDSPEALATIPRLTLADLDRENKTIPLEERSEAGTRVLYHDLFTNGIAYLDLGFDLHTLPQRYLPYVNLFGRALLEMGTETESFVQLLQRIGRKTGGIQPAPFTSSRFEAADGVAWLFLRGKAMADQTGDLLDILRDVLLTANLDNRERFRQIVLEEKVGKESSLVPAGHMVTISRLRAHFSEAAWANEQIGGVNYLFFLRQLVERIDSDWAGVLEDLQAIRDVLLNRRAMLANVTLDAGNWANFRPQLADFLSGLPGAPVEVARWTPDNLPVNEGLTIPAQVNYVGKGANLYQLGYELDGSSLPVIKYLSMTWLWERVRVQGGA